MMKRHRKRYLFASAGCVALVACIGVPTGAHAATQSETPTAQTSQAGDRPAAASAPVPSDQRLEDIVVTAQRRSENLQKAAIAVTAVTTDTLQRAGVSDTAQLTTVVPALQVSNVSGPAN